MSLVGLVAVFAACLAVSEVHGLAVSSSGAVLNNLLSQQPIANISSELSPYGMYPISTTAGNLTAGNFLSTQWSDAQNNPGQGRTILQVTPTGQTSVFATIPDSAVITSNCGSSGVGLTMALVVLSSGYVIVGSTPVPIGNDVAGAGCLIVLSSSGDVLDAHAANETTSTPGLLTGGGPWGMAVQEYNNGLNAYLFVSYVLGTDATSIDIQTGTDGGMVVRYGLTLTGGVVGSDFWGSAPDVIASGFPTVPGGITVGVVGPAGLVLGSPTGGAYDTTLATTPLFIANTGNSSLEVVQNATTCSNATVPCQLQTTAWLGLLDGPIGIAQSPIGTIVGTNGNSGTLFEVAPTIGADVQLAIQLVDNTPGDSPGAGALINVMFHPNISNALFFNDVVKNVINTLTPTTTVANSRRSRGLLNWLAA